MLAACVGVVVERVAGLHIVPHGKRNLVWDLLIQGDRGMWWDGKILEQLQRTIILMVRMAYICI